MKEVGEEMWRLFFMDYYLPSIMKKIIGDELTHNLQKNIEMSKFMANPASGIQMIESLFGLVTYEQLYDKFGPDNIGGKMLEVFLKNVDKKALFRLKRLQDAWKFGSALDYYDIYT
eukprot:TRINITY_DN26078_c0_g1_i1.p2 TRINITY_DN26078_c0_g1~~TRINITY_DN26078_c0_g1_i1.p2  ORF type:complete len:134 (-),score=24.25 TRINITY_DN26078_c0_g1_i1:157-504(-)